MRFLVFFILASSFVFGIGISPTDFIFELNKGDIVEKDFYVFNTKNEEVNYGVFVDGIDWFKFYPDSFEIKGNNKKKVKVILEVPGNVETGNYAGIIYFKEENSNKGFSLDSSVGVRFNINILNGNFNESKEIIESVILTGDITKDVVVVNKKDVFNYGLVVFLGLFLVVVVLFVFVVWQKVYKI